MHIPCTFSFVRTKKEEKREGGTGVRRGRAAAPMCARKELAIAERERGAPDAHVAVM